MAASSVTGRGNGASGKVTTKELSSFVNGPAVFITGYAEPTLAVSPSGYTGSVTFTKPLSGRSANYIVLVSSKNGGNSYVTAMNENADDDFSGFSFFIDEDAEIMYAVFSVGIRPEA